MNLRAAVKYKSGAALKSAGIFSAVLLAVQLVVQATARAAAADGGNSITIYSGYIFGAWVMMLVLGIVSVREDLRFFIQNGVGRRTTFAAQWVNALELATLLSLGGTAFQLLGGAIAGEALYVQVGGLYGALYARGAAFLTLGQQAEAIVLHMSFLAMAYMGGMFFSLLFYVLNKTMQVVAGVALPLLVFGGAPFLWDRFSGPITAAFHFLEGSPWHLLQALLFITAVVGTVNGLITRRIPIRGL